MWACVVCPSNSWIAHPSAYPPGSCGLALLGAGVWALERFVRSLLYGVKPSDPVILLGTLVLLGAAAFAASWLPARKAAAVEPLVALRD